MLKHTRECLAFQEKLRIAVEDYKKNWPNFCVHCEGRGVHIWTENGAPWGEGFWAMPMQEPCDDCTGIGKCPRCGQAGLTDEEKGNDTTGDGPCKFCGWNYEDHGMPVEFDGFCDCFSDIDYFLDESEKMDFEDSLNNIDSNKE